MKINKISDQHMFFVYVSSELIRTEHLKNLNYKLIKLLLFFETAGHDL